MATLAQAMSFPVSDYSDIQVLPIWTYVKASHLSVATDPIEGRTMEITHEEAKALAVVRKMLKRQEAETNG